MKKISSINALLLTVVTQQLQYNLWYFGNYSTLSSPRSLKYLHIFAVQKFRNSMTFVELLHLIPKLSRFYSVFKTFQVLEKQYFFQGLSMKCRSMGQTYSTSIVQLLGILPYCAAAKSKLSNVTHLASWLQQLAHWELEHFQQ